MGQSGNNNIQIGKSSGFAAVVATVAGNLKNVKLLLISQTSYINSSKVQNPKQMSGSKTKPITFAKYKYQIIHKNIHLMILSHMFQD